MAKLCDVCGLQDRGTVQGRAAVRKTETCKFCGRRFKVEVSVHPTKKGPGRRGVVYTEIKGART